MFYPSDGDIKIADDALKHILRLQKGLLMTVPGDEGFGLLRESEVSTGTLYRATLSLCQRTS
jgi:hypothetical protein